MRARALIVAAAMLTGLVEPAAAQNSGLVRLTQRGDLFGYEAVGRLEIGTDGYCTGVLIAPDLVLTAAHCVMRRDGTRLGPELRFRAGLRDGVAVAESAVRDTVVHPDYSPTDAPVRRIVFDAALVRLSSPIPAAVAAPFLVALPTEGREVSVVSYAQGRDEALSRQAACRITGRGLGLMSFDCDVTFGASGAPVFEWAGARGRIVSLISSGFRSEDESVSYGMELPQLVERLKRQLASGENVWPKPEFGARRIGVGVGTGDGTGTGGAKFVRP